MKIILKAQLVKYSDYMSLNGPLCHPPTAEIIRYSLEKIVLAIEMTGPSEAFVRQRSLTVGTLQAL